jgi:hypothetical protein
MKQRMLVGVGLIALTVPAARGGDYRISAAECSVAPPPPVEGGISVKVHGARSKIAIGAN